MIKHGFHIIPENILFNLHKELNKLISITVPNYFK